MLTFGQFVILPDLSIGKVRARYRQDTSQARLVETLANDETQRELGSIYLQETSGVKVWNIISNYFKMKFQSEQLTADDVWHVKQVQGLEIIRLFVFYGGTTH